MFKYNHDCPFEAYITNLASYNEGELQGEWVKFPVEKETIDEVFKKIGIGIIDKNGRLNDEWFVSDYDIYVENLSPFDLGEFISITELNEIAYKLIQHNL